MFVAGVILVTTNLTKSNLSTTTRFGSVDVKPAIRRRKKKRQMKWLSNLFLTKKKRIAKAQEAYRQEQLREEQLKKHLLELAKAVKKAEAEKQAATQKAPVKVPAKSAVKKQAIKSDLADAPVAKKKPTAKKK